MPPIPEPHVPSQLDCDDEESLWILSSVEKKWYSGALENPSCSEDSIENSGDSGNHCKCFGDRESQSQTSCLMRTWDAYYELLVRWPLIVKSITAFILMALADLLAQMVEHLRGMPHEGFLNVLRMLRFGVFGLIGAPWTHYYYDWLDRTLPPTPQPWTMTTAIKVVLDQGIQAPALLALIVMGLAFMEGRGIDGMKEDMQKQYMHSLIENWKLWIPATIFNIAFIKPALRVLYDNVVFLVWTIYLSMILNDKGDRTP